MLRKPDLESLDDWTRMREELVSRPNVTRAGIVFCLDGSQLFPQFFCASTENVRSYYILLNKTDSFGTIFSAPSLPAPTDPYALALKVLIDNAIIDFETGGLF